MMGAAMAVNPVRVGAAPELRWPLMCAAAIGGLILAFAHAPESRVPMAFVQALCGLVCMIIALLHFGMAPGPVAALLGGALMAFGAVDRLGLSVTVGPRA